ncbi:MAG: glutamate racemase [Candidatus Levybacteria bacterium]|nr:glutamate racemase [Candidatus Levybacteria bacterium]
MKNQPIGVLDSGVGGLSILREIIKKLPRESFIYLADSKNCPYGEKTSKEIYGLSRKMVKFLLAERVKLIVIACNTITVSCLDKLRIDFPSAPIIGIVPVVKTASKLTKNGRIGILSTKQTAKSKYQRGLIEKFTDGLKVLNLGTDKLVPIIETGEHKDIKILREELEPFLKFDIDTLALGCSHFPFLRKEIKQILGGKVRILDSGGAVARQVGRVLKNNHSLSVSQKQSSLLYTTGNVEKFQKNSSTLLGKRYAEMVKSAKRITL